MKISVITATYNSSATIAACVESVGKQTHPHTEHIIIDGASKDNTTEIIKTVPNKVSKIISEPDNGIYDAINKGIVIASGDIIGLLHSDDIFYSDDTLEKISKAFTGNNIHGVYGDLLYVNTDNRVVRTWKSNKFDRESVKYGWMPPHPTLFLRKEVYQKHGLFDSNFKIAGDYDFMLRVMNDKEINLEYLPQVITIMKMGGVSTGRLNDIITKSMEDIKALQNNGFKFPLAVLAAKNFRKIPQLFKR